MADLRALVFSTDLSPNVGTASPRPLARTFAFLTGATLEQVEAPDFVKSSELANVQVGEVVEIRGAGFTRTFALTGKQGEFAQLSRLGSENGVDPVMCGTLVIPGGKVHAIHQLDVTFGPSFGAGRLSVTPENCDVAYCAHLVASSIEIDIETANTIDTVFHWQVFP